MTLNINKEQFELMKDVLMKRLQKIDFYSDDWERHLYLCNLYDDLKLLERKEEVDQDYFQKEKEKLSKFFFDICKLNTGDKIEIGE